MYTHRWRNMLNYGETSKNCYDQYCNVAASQICNVVTYLQEICIPYQVCHEVWINVLKTRY